jgi:hypothetical protein
MPDSFLFFYFKHICDFEFKMMYFLYMYEYGTETYWGHYMKGIGVRSKIMEGMNQYMEMSQWSPCIFIINKQKCSF